MTIGKRIIEAAIRARVSGPIDRDDKINVYLGFAEFSDFKARELSPITHRAPESATRIGYVEWNGFRVHEVMAPSHFGIGIVGIP